jgi:hypothetical protein
MKDVTVRRASFSLTLCLLVLVMVESPASALCGYIRFDRAVRQADGVWWARVTGVERIHNGQLFGWGLETDVQDALKGSVGDHPLVMANGCTVFSGERSYAEQFVGRTELFVGYMSQNILIMNGLIMTPGGMSPEGQYQRARQVLGLPPVQASPLAPSESSGLPAWVVAGAVALAVLIAVALLALIRRGLRSRSAAP